MTHERTDHRGVAAQVSTAAAGSARGVGYGKWIVPFCLTAGYGLFAVAVHLRWLDGLDVAARHAVHAGEVWGPTQVRATGVVDALQPTHLALPLLLVVAAMSLLRRSLRPFAVTILVGFPILIGTLGSKWVMAHWDPGTVPVGHGSFPSGHAVSVITVFGLVVLLLRPGTHWGWMLPAAMGCVMGGALVLASVHPVTDVLGAGLLVGAALAWAATAQLGQWASDAQGNSSRSRAR